MHGVENATVHGLEAVPDVGERSTDDDRHGVGEVRLGRLEVKLEVDDAFVLDSGVAAAPTARHHAGRHVAAPRVAGEEAPPRISRSIERSARVTQRGDDGAATGPSRAPRGVGCGERRGR